MKKLIAKIFLGVTGWKAEGPVPTPSRYVLIAAPHTSNWDLVYLLALSWALGAEISWMGKHTIFRAPFGAFMRAMGGVPVRRDRRNDLVTQMAELFDRSPSLILTVPVEATRERTDYWKSGFYHIARAARVPVVPGFLDYARRRGGFGPPLEPTGDIGRDMDVLRAFYSDKLGKHPEKFGEVRLLEEDQPQPQAVAQ